VLLLQLQETLQIREEDLHQDFMAELAMGMVE